MESRFTPGLGNERQGVAVAHTPQSVFPDLNTQQNALLRPSMGSCRHKRCSPDYMNSTQTHWFFHISIGRHLHLSSAYHLQRLCIRRFLSSLLKARPPITLPISWPISRSPRWAASAASRTAFPPSPPPSVLVFSLPKFHLKCCPAIGKALNNGVSTFMGRNSASPSATLCVMVPAFQQWDQWKLLS